MRSAWWVVASACVALAAAAAPVRAGLVIDAFYDTSILNLPTQNRNAVEAGIQAAISRVESVVANPITVNIGFEIVSGGLGQSETAINNLPYTTYLSDLEHHQILSANDRTALASLPGSTTGAPNPSGNNPVNGNADVFLTLPLLRALGESTLGDNGGDLDGLIGLNTSIMNLSRTGTQNPSFYDLQAVAGHEIDEVLGIGGTGSVLQLAGSYTGQANPTGPVGVLDLYRYSGNGVRSFSLNPSAATPYFSIDGGNTDITHFNQNGANGEDFADWGTNPTHQLQDAVGFPGHDLNIGTNEETALDVVGYNLATPEPSTFVLAAIGGITGFASLYRRRRG